MHKDTSTANCSLSSDEIYSIINFVIKEEKFNRQYGLDIIPYNIDYSDTSFLKTLLIKPSPNKTFSENFVTTVTLPIGIPDRNILTQADIDYILCSQQSLRQFKWDNKKLHFNLKNKKYYYSFSVPYFNLTHDKVIVKYEKLCPGLCGNGQTLLLTKKGGSWDIGSLEMWIH